MAQSIQAGEVVIPARVDMDQAVEDLQVRLPKAAQEGGRKTGKELADELKKAFDTKQAIAKESLARKIISPEEFKRAINEAKREFNQGLLPELKRLRAAGQENSDEYAKLARSLKSIGPAGRQGAQEARSWMDRLHGGVTSMATAVKGFIALLALRTVYRFFEDSIRVAENAASQWDVLGANVENAGVSFQKVRPDIEAAAKAVQMATRFDDEEYAGALSELVSITHNYARSMGAMDVVVDVASAKHKNLEETANAVGRALSGNTTLLSRWGVKLKEGVDVVQQLREQYAGTAEKEGRGLVGFLARLRNAWEDDKQAVGEVLLSNEAAAKSGSGLVDKLVALEGWIRKNADTFQGLVEAGGAVVQVLAWIATAVGKAVTGWQLFGAYLPVGIAHLEVWNLKAKSLFQDTVAGIVEWAGKLGQKIAGAPKAVRMMLGFGDDDKAAADAMVSWAEGVKRRNTEAIADAIVNLHRLQRAADEVKAEITATLNAPVPKGPTTGGGGGGVVGPTEEQIKKAKELLAKWHEEQLSELEKQLAKAKEIYDAALIAGTPEDKARAKAQVDEIQAVIDRLKVLRAEVLKLGPHLVQSIAAIGPQLKALLPTIASLLVPPTDRYEKAMADLKEKVARGLITPQEAKKQGDAAARAFNASLLGILTTLRQTGKLTDAAFKEITDALKDVGDGADSTAAKVEKIADAFATVARGVLSVLDAMGALDERTRKVVEGFINLAEGAAKFAKAAATHDVAGMVSSGVQTVGGLVQTIAGIFGQDKEAQEEARKAQLQAISAMLDLREALDKLRTAVLANVAPAERAYLLGALQPVIDQLAKLPGLHGDMQLDPATLTPALLDAYRRLQTATGVNFLNEGAGTFDVDKLRQALAILNGSDLGEFAKDLTGQLDALDFIFGQLGDAAGSASDKLKKFITTVATFSPAFAANLQRILDEQGPDAALAFVQGLVQEFATSGLTDRIIGEFGAGRSAEEVRRLLEESNKYLEDLTKTGGAGASGETTAFQVSRTITERQADLLISVLTTLAFWAERTALAAEAAAAALTGGTYSPAAHGTAAAGLAADPFSALLPLQERETAAVEALLELVRAYARPVAMPTPVQVPLISPPAPELYAAGEGAGGVTLQIDRLVNIEQVGGGVTAAERDQVVAAGVEAGRAAVRSVDIALARRLRDVRRAQGRS